MGVGTLPTRANAQTIDETWFNILKTAFTGDLLGRNLAGFVTANYGQLGSPAVPWKSLHLGDPASGISIEETTPGSKVLDFKVNGTIVGKLSALGFDRNTLSAPNLAISSRATGLSGTATVAIADVPALDVTITTSGRPVLLMLIADPGVGSGIYSGGPPNFYCEHKITSTASQVVNAFSIASMSFHRGAGSTNNQVGAKEAGAVSDYTSGATLTMRQQQSNTSPIIFFDQPPAGTHLYHARRYATFATTGLGYTHNATATNWGIGDCRLLALELA